MPLTCRNFIRTTTASGLLLPFAPRAQEHSQPCRQCFVTRGRQWRNIDRSRHPPDTPHAAPPTHATDVRWTITTDPAITKVVASGSVQTGESRDYTVKIDAAGLEPGRSYYYGFAVGSEHSPIGRTRTLPAGDVKRLRFAVVCCSNYPYGFVSRDRVQGDFYIVPTVTERSPLEVHAASFGTERGSAHLEETTRPSPTQHHAPPAPSQHW
jgi:phosphodiesterase/alkaline phosphatase D-like protein